MLTTVTIQTAIGYDTSGEVRPFDVINRLPHVFTEQYVYRQKATASCVVWISYVKQLFRSDSILKDSYVSTSDDINL